MNRREFLKSGLMLGAFGIVLSLPFISGKGSEIFAADKPKKLPFKKVVKTDAEWKRILTA